MASNQVENSNWRKRGLFSKLCIPSASFSNPSKGMSDSQPVHLYWLCIVHSSQAGAMPTDWEQAKGQEAC